MDGLFLMTPDASRTLRKFPLSHIARWAIPPSAGGAALILYTRTPVDVEEVTLTLSGSPSVIRAVLDTLTCCCMQIVEVLESEREAAEANANSNSSSGAHQTHQRRHSSGGFRRRKAPPALPAAEDVEFWHSPDKEGWLQSQGDHIKTWRRRWHVLKQGYLFRFASEKDAVAGSSSRPRGVVDLSKITDVSGGGVGSSGAAAMISLSTPQGASISYLADSETEAVEWVSALESSVAKIVRAVAGFDEEEDAADDDRRRLSSPPSHRSSRGNNGSCRPSRPSSSHQHHAENQPSSFDAANSAAAGLAAAGGNPFVSVVGYEGVVNNSASSPHHSASHYQEQHQHYAPTAPVYGNGNGGGGGIGYDRGGEMAGGAVFGGGPTFGGVAGVAASTAPAAATPPYVGGGGYPPVADPAGAAAAAAAAPYAPYQPVQQQPQPATAAAAPPAAAPPPLPEPWQVHYTSDGRAYFYNSSTNATQWEPPQAASLV